MVAELYSGIGVSELQNSYDAGVGASRNALENLGTNKKPDALLVFASPRFNHQKLIDGIVSVTKKTPLVGGTTAGEIFGKVLNQGSVVVIALNSGNIRFIEGIAKEVRKNEKYAGICLGRDILKKAGKYKKIAKSLILLPDGLAGDGLSLITGVKDVLGEDFEIVGGALGDDSNFKKTYQYYNGKVYCDSVVGLLICGDFRTATGVGSGWESIGPRFKCTKAKGNIVYKFGNKKALDAYEEYLGVERSSKLPAIGLEYPMGMIDDKAEIDGNEYFQIRCPLAINSKLGSITFAAAIPEGKEVTLTYSSRNSIINGSRLSAMQAKKTLGSKSKPLIILMFSCVARKIVLGRRTNEEINAVKRILGKDAPIIGFYTYGEIGPIDKRVPLLKSARWHNETIVIWVLGT